MDSVQFGQEVRDRRRRLGLTQTELAREARVSLATLQNVEAGRANPALRTMESLLDVLGLSMDCVDKPCDWAELAALGAPLSQPTERKVSRTPARLPQALHRALAQKPRGREKESLQALLLALKSHFPTFYERHCGSSQRFAKLTPVRVSGRLVKLSRIAREALAGYL